MYNRIMRFLTRNSILVDHKMSSGQAGQQNWLYLGQQQVVSRDEQQCSSRSVTLEQGVAHVSILDPLLFLLYANNLCLGLGLSVC